MRIIIKGKQGEGKTMLANQIIALLSADKKSVSLQDGEDTRVHQQFEASGKKIPVSVHIIVKQA